MPASAAMARFGPIVEAGLALLAERTKADAWVQAGNALNDASSGGPTARLARKAVDRLAANAAQEFREVGAADREAVEERVKHALRTGEKPGLVAAALLGEGQFTVAMSQAGCDASGLADSADGYLTAMLRAVQALLTAAAREPEVLAEAMPFVIAAVTDRLERLELSQPQLATRSDLLEAIARLQAELERRTAGRGTTRQPGQILIGRDILPAQAVDFIDRPEAAVLSNALAQGSTATLCQLNGMRGVGKSQIAASFARACTEAGFDVVVWIDARTRASVLTAMSRLAESYGVLIPDTSPEENAARVLDAMAATPDERRLIVFDSVEDYGDLVGARPDDGQTRVVITTVKTTGTLGQRVPVGLLPDEDGADYLLRRTGLSDREGALDLTGTFGGLVLALAQAAAVITRRGYDFTRYRAALAAQPVADHVLMEEDGSYPRSTAQAINLAIDTVLTHPDVDGAAHDDPLRPELVAVLDALSLLAESGAPVAWLRTLGDEFRVDEAIAQLVGSSLAEFSEDKVTVSQHRLTRRVYAEERLGADADLARARNHAVRALSAGLPAEDSMSYDARRGLLASWLPYVASLSDPTSRLTGSADLLDRVQRGVYLGNEHHLPYAVIACAALLETVADVLGPDHPNTLASRNNLAYAYQSAGDLSRAIPLYQQPFTDRERVLGPDHPNTLTSRNNLAYAYQSAGDLSRAIPLYQQTLTDRERVLGPDHPNTLTSRNNLAYAYRSVGDLGRAIPLYQQTLTDRERVLGPDHPDTLTSRNNLALALWGEGQRQQGLTMMSDAAERARRALSPGHPLIAHLAGQERQMAALLAAQPLP